MARLAMALLFSFAVPAALAQIPDAPNCKVDRAPPDAGLYGTPGGFLMVHPRNAAVSDSYTGCRTLWVVDTPDRLIRLMVLYFENGRLRVARAYDKDGSIRGTCTVPTQARECEGVESNPLTALRLPTWPRSCMDRPTDPQCAKDPD